MNIELRQVYDHEGDNECDRCGRIIYKDQIYFAAVDDVEIVCVECVLPEERIEL